MRIKKMLFCSIVSIATIGYIAVGCSDPDDSKNGAYDPSKPVVFETFTPDSGSVRTRFFIKGDNFGNDPSKIKVEIGGRETNVIGVTGNEIYCMVPRRAYDGVIKVVIHGDNDEIVAEHAFKKLFKYKPNTTVSTLTGKRDPATGNSSIIDGTFEEAEFQELWWLLFDETADGERMLYLGEEGKAFRKVDLNKEMVSTVFTNGQGSFVSMKTMSFDHTGDTIFFADDHGQDNDSRPVLTYAIRGESFRKVYPYVYDRTGYTVAVHPTDGTIFYNTYWNGGVDKVRGQQNPITHQWESKKLFNLVDNSSEHTYFNMHPEGKYVYVTGMYRAIVKLIYNPDTKELLTPIIHAGSIGQSGYEDAAGTRARFTRLRQGTFVRNEEYVKAGKEDVYDFYVCDEDNHCIRKVTPNGEVSTFAGRGSFSVDGKVEGYIDGELRKEARFAYPNGIAYDEKNAIFYVADRGNKRIRYITVE